MQEVSNSSCYQSCPLTDALLLGAGGGANVNLLSIQVTQQMQLLVRCLGLFHLQQQQLEPWLKQSVQQLQLQPGAIAATLHYDMGSPTVLWWQQQSSKLATSHGWLISQLCAVDR